MMIYESTRGSLGGNAARLALCVAVAAFVCALAGCTRGGTQAAAFRIVKSDHANCGVFKTCFNVTVRNDGDTAGPATCSLVQYERGSNRQLVAGNRVRSGTVAPGDSTVVALSIDPKPVTAQRTRPLPYCEPYATTD